MTVPSILRGNPNRRRRRRVSTKALVILAVVACFMLLIGRGTAQIIGRYSCSSSQIVLNVAVSPDVAPAITKIADYFNSRQLKADGRCVSVSVNTEAPALAAGQIDGQQPRPHPAIDAWIPDSSLWVDQVRGYALGAQTVQPAGYSIALSPLLLVMPERAAAHTAAFGKTGWRLLLPRSAGGPAVPANLSVNLPDPTESAAGLASLIEIGRYLGPGTAGRVRFTRFIYSSQVTTYFDDPVSLRYFASLGAPPLSGDPVTVTTEQAVLAYDRQYPRQPLAATYPTGGKVALGSPELDYPYVLTTTDAARIDAAELFGRVLTEPYARGVIRYDGFRTGKSVPDEFPRSSGLGKQLLQVATPPSASEAPTALAVWNKLALSSRDLTMVDVSSAMAAPADPANPTGPTFEQELTQTASLGLALFPDTANIGLWKFADNLDHGRPYKQLVSVGPLPENMGVITRRTQLQRINGTLPPNGGPNVALYGTILDAYKYMQKTYKPKFFNTVIVLASGIDNAPGDITADELLKKLTRLSNSPRKVAVIIISFSPSADFPMLKKIALATGGQAYRITDPTRVAQVFYQALAHRLCGHGCVAP
ncbi:MAG TPA: substrate-binding domain-containing protein [Streptosporangiaceae bacterium]